MKFGIGQLLFVLLMLGLLGASYYFVFTPAAQKRTAKQAETTLRKKELADLHQSIAGIGDVEKKTADLEKAITFFESKLPQEKEIDTIIKAVWQEADRNALQMRTIKTMKTERSAGYCEQPIQMTLAGDFKGYYAFLLKLETMARITRLSQMKLEKITSKDGEMQAQMTLSIFFEPGDANSHLARIN
ncbi:MAG: type 4a pilus biogenesis protein PilO [Bacillota bacterium]